MTSVGQLRPGNPRMCNKQCERNERASPRGTAIHFSGRKSEISLQVSSSKGLGTHPSSHIPDLARKPLTPSSITASSSTPTTAKDNKLSMAHLLL